mgnify:FL=1
MTETAFGLTAKIKTGVSSTVKLDDSAKTAVTEAGVKASNRTDLVFTVEASANTEYVSEVTYKITTAAGAGSATPIEAVDGKYTISAEELKDASEVEIDVTEESLIVVTNVSSEDLVIAINDETEGTKVVKTTGTIGILPGDTIKVVTPAAYKPDISDFAGATMTGPVPSGNDKLVWTISGIAADGDLDLADYLPVP